MEEHIPQKALPEPYHHLLKIPAAYLEKKTCTIAVNQETGDVSYMQDWRAALQQFYILLQKMEVF